MHAPTRMDHLHAEALFERRWAMVLLDRVLSRLEREWSEKRERFEQLSPFCRVNEACRFELTGRGQIGRIGDQPVICRCEV